MAMFVQPDLHLEAVPPDGWDVTLSTGADTLVTPWRLGCGGIALLFYSLLWGLRAWASTGSIPFFAAGLVAVGIAFVGMAYQASVSRDLVLHIRRDRIELLDQRWSVGDLVDARWRDDDGEIALELERADGTRITAFCKLRSGASDGAVLDALLDVIQRDRGDDREVPEGLSDLRRR